MQGPANPVDKLVANRRRQLQLWIDEKYNSSQTDFIASTNDGIKQLNQGELSGLLRNKSFGERKARSLELMAHMPGGYLDWPPELILNGAHWVGENDGQLGAIASPRDIAIELVRQLPQDKVQETIAFLKWKLAESSTQRSGH